MPRSLRVLLAQANHGVCDLLEKTGHRVRAVEPAQLRDACRADKPDVILSTTDIAAVCDEMGVPWIFHLNGDIEPFSEPPGSTLMGVLVGPLSQSAVHATVVLAVSRYDEIRKLEVALEDRKLTERAKGIVMNVLGVEEEEAYSGLRRYASNHNLRLADAAKIIIDCEAPFRELKVTCRRQLA
jgi:hypothetical protein